MSAEPETGLIQETCLNCGDPECVAPEDVKFDAEGDALCAECGVVRHLCDYLAVAFVADPPEAVARTYRTEEAVEVLSPGHKRVSLKVFVGETLVGKLVVLSGPEADVDDYLNNVASLEEISKKWIG